MAPLIAIRHLTSRSTSLFGKGLDMPSPLVSLAFGASLLFVASSDSVPTFDPGPSCRVGAQTGVELQPNVTGCVQDEERARASLVKEWQQFSPNDKNSCVAEAESGGPRSYIELQTCLEVARDAKDTNIE
jgi:hypothetical protein